MKNLSLDNIQKIWVLLGAIIGQFAGGWMPEFIIQLFGPEGTDIFFKLIGAAISLWQFLDIRTGKKEAELNAQVSGAGKAPQALKAESNKLYYALNPFAKAA